ncbi:MAG TPA: hypothetical protein VL122_02035 [Nitrospirota bacterium]|nr:hypothetical protein [Nitrospirota bacterium]
MSRSLLVVRNVSSPRVSLMLACRIMKKSSGGFKQAYNAQAGIGTDSLLIVT